MTPPRARVASAGMASGTFCDLAMAYDATARRCDLVFDGRGFVLDRTAATALLISLGTERRADPDDVPPGTQTDEDTYAGGKPSARRGCPGDALDRNGQFMGSRLWLLDDAKQTEETRQDAVAYMVEATAWIEAKGVATGADASWIRPNTLGLLAQAGSTRLSLPMSLA